MLTFRLNERNDVLSAGILLVLLFVATPLCAQQQTSSSRTVTPGDTFAVDLPVESSFHAWELNDYDVRKLSLVSKEPPSGLGRYRFVFETLGQGQTSLEFQRLLETAISRETLENRTVNVTVREETPEPATEEPEAPDEEPSPSPEPEPEEPEPEPSPEEGGTQPATAPDPAGSAWDEANELIETGQHDEARDLIQEQIGDAAGEERQRWMNLVAESHMDQENYGEAIAQWEDMIDEFSQGPKAEWLRSVARAHRLNGANDQAELALIQIRHRHRDSPQWEEAMQELGNMALEDNNVERARELLEEVESSLSGRRNPEVLMQLAEIYDRYPPTRNYYKAVKLYQRAARRFDSSDTRGRKAQKRASYLRENFLNFGTQ